MECRRPPLEAPSRSSQLFASLAVFEPVFLSLHNICPCNHAFLPVSSHQSLSSAQVSRRVQLTLDFCRRQEATCPIFGLLLISGDDQRSAVGPLLVPRTLLLLSLLELFRLGVGFLTRFLPVRFLPDLRFPNSVVKFASSKEVKSYFLINLLRSCPAFFTLSCLSSWP